MQTVPHIIENAAHNSAKHAISSEKFIFSGERAYTPLLLPNQAFLDPPLPSPRIPARLTPAVRLKSRPEATSKARAKRP